MNNVLDIACDYGRLFRSWQTPPTQPVPQKESEAERKARSRLQRQSRRSTQGVTIEQLNEARAASEDIGKWRSATLQQTSVTNNPAQKRSVSPDPSIKKVKCANCNII